MHYFDQFKKYLAYKLSFYEKTILELKDKDEIKQ